jgi:hypothetical protein
VWLRAKVVGSILRREKLVICHVPPSLNRGDQLSAREVSGGWMVEV